MRDRNEPEGFNGNGLSTRIGGGVPLDRHPGVIYKKKKIVKRFFSANELQICSKLIKSVFRLSKKFCFFGNLRVDLSYFDQF